MGAKASAWVISISVSLASSSSAMKVTTSTVLPLAGSNSSSNSTKRRPCSVLSTMLMYSRTLSSSRVILWCCTSRARFRMSRQASCRSTTCTSGNRGCRLCSMYTCAFTKSRPYCGSCPRRMAAIFICSYSSRRRTSSARGSSASSAPSCFLGGSNMRDLISMSIAAISRYSAASSRLRLRISSTYTRYWRVRPAMGMSRMLKFCLRIRYSSRSSGPSKASRKTSSASGGM